MEFPKPKHKPKKSREPNPQKQQRIVDPVAVEAARRTYCVACGISHSDPKQLPVHHIYTKSAGHGDVEDNLICVCIECHAKAHNGIKTKDHLKYMLEQDLMWGGRK